MPTASYPDDRHYDTSHKNRGKFIIIHHTAFQNKRLKERAGNDQDVANLKKTFEEFGFGVVEIEDQTYETIDKQLKESKQRISIRSNIYL